jgi:hypothetical protein
LMQQIKKELEREATKALRVVYFVEYELSSMFCSICAFTGIFIEYS